MDTVNDRTIRDAGTPDAVWVPWLAQRGLKSLALADIFPPASPAPRLVVVAPHPDDEILACGGLLAACVQQQLPTLVVAVTDGEASHGSGNRKALARLGAQRTEESHSGLLRLGVKPASVIRLCLPDGKVASCLAYLTAQLKRLLLPGDVVVTTWRLDGHPDHESTGAAAAQACFASGCSLLQAPVWMWHWARPDDTRVPWAGLAAFDIPQELAALKQHALRSHQSQLLDREGQGPVLAGNIVERAARRHEYFFV